MYSARITEDLAKKVVFAIKSENFPKKDSISFEIQDDYQHLLVSISVDGIPDGENSITFNKIGRQVDRMIPKRKGEYSWMVVFTRNGKVIDSHFGGDIDDPKSGL